MPMIIRMRSAFGSACKSKKNITGDSKDDKIALGVSVSFLVILFEVRSTGN